MLQPIGVLMFVACVFLGDPESPVTSRSIIYALAGAVASLAGAVAAMGIYIAKSSKRHQEKVDELYEARISDLKEAHDLVDTLMGVVNREKGGS